MNIRIYPVSDTVKPLCKYAKECLRILSDPDVYWEDNELPLPKNTISDKINWNDNKPPQLVSHRTEYKATSILTIYSVKMPNNIRTPHFSWKRLLVIWVDGYQSNDDYTIQEILEFIRLQFLGDFEAYASRSLIDD